MTLKVGDYVARKHFINFWPGKIIYINPARVYNNKAKVFWFDKNDWYWLNISGLKALRKLSPLEMLAMEAE